MWILGLPSIKEFFEIILNGREQYRKRKERFFANAWKNESLMDVYRLVKEYYIEMEKEMFSYYLTTGKKVTMPLYVAKGWDDLSSSTINMSFEEKLRDFEPTKTQIAFWDLYHKFKKDEIGADRWPLYDAPTFRLKEFNMVNGVLHLNFELCNFADWVMCQYLLENELVISLAKKYKKTKSCKFNLRNNVAADKSMIHSFFTRNIGRIGICNLILLRADERTYIPIVHKRSQLSMIQHSLLDTVSSCIFEVVTTAKADFELQHTVLREVYEELFRNEDVAVRSKRLDPYFFYKEDGVADLISMIKDGTAIFEVTGFCIDLIRIVPEITTLLVVRDQQYWKRHYRPSDPSIAEFKLNLEFALTSSFGVMSDIVDLDKYLMTQVRSTPDADVGKMGFDPMKWTLPGGFSFYQGLKRAVSRNLL